MENKIYVNSYEILKNSIKKSYAISLLLTTFFGPLGIIYTSPVLGIIATLMTTFLSFVTLGFAYAFIWPICIIIGLLDCWSINRRIEKRYNIKC